MWQIEPTEWEVHIYKNIRVWFLSQNFIVDPDTNVLDALFRHDHTLWQLIRKYEQMMLDPSADSDDLQKILSEIEDANAWEYEVQVKTIISKLQLTHLLTQNVGSLSWWEAKRVALAKALLDEPDFLVLDEPTNHLDLDMIEWLERYLSQSSLTLLMVTHDRYFLDGICSDIIELARGKIYHYPGNYELYLEKKAEREELEQRALHHLKQVWRKELAWVRKAPRGRWTKSVSREKKFDVIDESYFDTKTILQQSAKKLTLSVEKRKLWAKIIKIHHLKKKFGDKVILEDFSHDFKEWERIGIIWKNWVGKSTFVHILTWDEQPDSGDIAVGEKVVMGHYQQKDIAFNTDKKVIDIVRDIAPSIQVGKTKLSAAQLLERFLFPPQMQQQSAYMLSWWEKRRLHLLTVLVQNPNFLILDEPTNDLDLVTLAILEEFLLEYSWCLLVISHDRYFMDKIVDHIFAFTWEGKVVDFRGSYTDYTHHSNQLSLWIKKQEKIEKQKSKNNIEIAGPMLKKKLTFQEKHEFEQLWKEIAILEKRVDEINFIFQHQTVWLEDMKKLWKEMDTLVNTLGEKETRWLELCERE